MPQMTAAAHGRTAGNCHFMIVYVAIMPPDTTRQKAGTREAEA